MNDRRPTPRQFRILKQLRQGATLAEGTSKYAVAKLDDYVEVEVWLVEEMEKAGWIYVIDVTKGRRSWKLTKDGLAVLDGVR